MVGQCLEKAEEFAQAQGLELPRGAAADPGAFSADQLADALRLALEEGIQFACKQAMKEGGFANNINIKIPYPPEIEEVVAKLRDLGQGDLIDQLVAKLNEAAEKAASKAVDICVNAVKEMSVDDAARILKGSVDACTQYLIRKCRTPLLDAMRPLVVECLQECGVIFAWQAIQAAWGHIPSIPYVWEKPDFPDMNIEDYALGKGADGLFFLVAEKEKGIRQDANSAANELVQKVFAEFVGALS